MLEIRPITTALDPDALMQLRVAVHGNMILPEDDYYDAARTLWNGMVDKHPAVIVRPRSAADVQEAIAFACAHALPLAVRGGGHSFAGKSSCDGGIVIDFANMKAITVDPEARTARAEAGCLLGDLDRATQAYGLVTPAGTVSHTGIAGLTLGGGYGWLSRKYGLTIDNLLAVEIVTADGQIRTANANEHPDLFWGVRGGGGNFGVVTAFTYHLHPVGPVLLGGPVGYTLDDAADALRFYAKFMATAPDELTVYATLITVPPAPPFPTHLHGQKLLLLDTCYAGEIASAERAVAPLRAFGTPVFDMIGPMPYIVRQTTIDAANPHGFHRYAKGGYLRALDDQAITALVTHFACCPSPMSAAIVARIGGAAARVTADATAFGDRTAPYFYELVSQWLPGDEAKPHVAWARDLAEDLTLASTGGVYVNSLGDEGQERVRAAYGAEKYDRLAALKAKYDPENLFRLNQNILPAR